MVAVVLARRLRKADLNVSMRKNTNTWLRSFVWHNLHRRKLLPVKKRDFVKYQIEWVKVWLEAFSLLVVDVKRMKTTFEREVGQMVNLRWKCWTHDQSTLPGCTHNNTKSLIDFKRFFLSFASYVSLSQHHRYKAWHYNQSHSISVHHTW